MKFAVKKSATVSLAAVASLALFAACGIAKNPTSTLNSALQEREVELIGSDAAAFFDALESAGLEPATVDGQIIYGATTLKADAVHCAVISDRDSTKGCEVIDGRRQIELVDKAVISKLISVMKRIGAQIDPGVIGAMNFDVRKVSCTKPVVPNPQVHCRYELSQGRSDSEVELTGSDADAMFDALESAGLEPATVDGQIIYGATTLKADAVHCAVISDRNSTKGCEVIDGRRQIELVDKAVISKLISVMERIGAQINPEVIGAMNFDVREVSCTKPVVPNPEVTCSLKLVK